LKITDLIFRAWYYFRLGYGTYLSFFVGFATFISTTYYLAIEKISFLSDLFGRFYEFAVLAILIIIPASVGIGWLHMKRTLAYSTDIEVSVEANPYNYVIVPGKEKEIYAPLWLTIMDSLERILEKQNLLTDEEKKEIEKIRSNISVLMKGGVIGKPRLRHLLAQLKKMQQIQ